MHCISCKDPGEHQREKMLLGLGLKKISGGGEEGYKQNGTVCVGCGQDQTMESCKLPTRSIRCVKKRVGEKTSGLKEGGKKPSTKKIHR